MSEGAPSKQNIRVSAPSAFTVGISTEPGVMENAARCLLGLGLGEIKGLAKAFSNLKIGNVTVWDGGKGADGKTATSNFLSGLVGSLPPLHEVTKNVGVKLPEYFGKLSGKPSTERLSGEPPESKA